MHRRKIVLFTLLFFAGACLQKVFSQVVASKTIGCVPLQVSFTAPPGATSANWNFGNGSSAQLNPNNVYSSPGVYNVTYSGTGGSPLNASIQITVVANNIVPSINFNIPYSHCAPMSVPFAGSSTGGGNKFEWDFSDGVLAIGANLTHIYTLGGVFNPTLSVKDTITGCTSTISAGPINVSVLANLIIDANPGLNSCMAPFTTAFTASNSASGSPLTSALTYSWNFAGGQPAASTATTPGSVVFNNQGYFNVSLSATDDNTCTTTTTVVVTVIQPTLSVTVPGTVCISGQQPGAPPLPQGSPIFGYTVTSSQPNTTWQMGDGNTFIHPAPPLTAQPGVPSTSIYPLYTTPGLKTLTISAAAGTCVATVTKTIMVEEVVPQFTVVPPTYTCSPNLIVNVVNQSSVNTGNPMTYTWSCSHWNQQPADAYTSTATNPTFTITQASLNPYTHYEVYHAPIHLIAQSSLGCWAPIRHLFDSIRRPSAWFNKDKKQGCAPLTVRFRDSSDTYYQIYPIQSYTWNNGANPATLVTGTYPPSVFNPTFTYNAAGTYTPYLIITTAGGCRDTSFIDTVTVVNPPAISAFIPDTLVCAGKTLQVNMSATPSSSVVQHWHAQSDDGFFSGCVSNPNPVWYFTHPGIRTFTISAYDHSCGSGLVSAQTVTVQGPMAKARYRTNCINKRSVEFFSQLLEVETAILDFGDNVTHTITGNPTGTVSDVVTHSYSATGDYTATLTSTNSLTGCAPYTFTMLVTVREIMADFEMEPIMCKGGVVTFTATNSIDVLTGCSRGYAWFLDTLEPHQLSSPIYGEIINEPGTHTITLWVKDVNGCTDTTTKTFIIDSPSPSFSFSSGNPACISNMPLQLVNTTPQWPVATSGFVWDFGNGTNPPFYSWYYSTNSVNDWPAHTYTASTPFKTYTVSLKAQSLLYGCEETYSMVLQVNNPFVPNIYAFAPGGCVGVPMNFNVTSSPNGSMAVNFGDGSLPVTPGFSPMVSHTYSSTGIYTPAISFTDPDGCVGSSTLSVIVQSPPVTDFTIAPSILCAPQSATFTSTSVSSFSLNYKWNLGNGSPIVNQPQVGALYVAPGTKTVTLIASTYPGSCTATMVHTLVVKQPTATVVIDKPSFCLGETIALHMKDTADLMGWNWYFGDGVSTGTALANSAPTQTISYPYTYYPPPFGTAVVSLVYFTSAFSCTNTAQVNIKVTKVDANFNRNDELAVKDSVHCLNVPDLFTNKSQINNSTFINGLYFNWDFGNGVTSGSMSPGYIYPSPGMYTITLKVTDPQAGCVDVSVKHMTINPLPTASIALPDSVCSGSNFVLVSSTSTDVSQYQWQPAEGVSSPNTATTIATATTSTTYTLLVTSIYGCAVLSNTENVYVQEPIVPIQWDTTIVIGQTALMNVNFGTFYTYTWSPTENLSCEHCPYATSNSTANITYTVEVEDNMGCFRTTHTFSVYVDPVTSIDVPTAFTPNGDGVNDVIYVDGWGIKKLNYFRIFNRWGQLLFESYDIKVGWDGTYKGVPQNMETYIYQASAEGYLPGTLMEKTSSFRLIR
jgi:gliding motility-associated-like protein